MANFYYAPTINAFSTTLNGAISDSATTLTLNSVTGLQNARGVLVIDRQNSAGDNTPSAREYISFTGVSGSTITGVTRGIAGSTAQSHADGALIEAMIDVTQWNDVVDILDNEHTSSGTHILSAPTITGLVRFQQFAVSSIASIARAEIGTLVANSHIGVKGQIFFQKSGALTTSLVTVGNTSQMGWVRTTKNLTLNAAYAGVMSAPSLGVATFNVMFYSTPTSLPTTIFSTKPTIDVGEYSTDTAAAAPVIAYTSIASGAILKPEILTPQGAGDLMMQLQVTERI